MARGWHLTEEQKYIRFFNQIDFPSGMWEACWVWKGYKTPSGYGRYKWFQDRKNELAHRLMVRFFYEVDPHGYEVCHKCDNPSCVNPQHLFLGSH